MINNDDAKINPASGVMIMIGITVILAFLIAASLTGSMNIVLTNYKDIITVQKTILLVDDYGVIDTYGRGFHFYPASLFKENETYNIIYHIRSNGERYISSVVSINQESELYKFKCVNINGVCK